MSHAQNPSRKQSLTIDILAEKMVQMMETIQDLRNQIQDLRIDTNQTRLSRE